MSPLRREEGHTRTVQLLIRLELRRGEVRFDTRAEAGRDARELAQAARARGAPPRDAARPLAVPRARAGAQAHVAQRGDALRELERERLGAGVEDCAGAVVGDADAQADDVETGKGRRDVFLLGCVSGEKGRGTGSLPSTRRALTHPCLG